MNDAEMVIKIVESTSMDYLDYAIYEHGGMLVGNGPCMIYMFPDGSDLAYIADVPVKYQLRAYSAVKE